MAHALAHAQTTHVFSHYFPPSLNTLTNLIRIKSWIWQSKQRVVANRRRWSCRWNCRE